MKQLQLNLQVENIKAEKPYFKKMKPDAEEGLGEVNKFREIKKKEGSQEGRSQVRVQEMQTPKGSMGEGKMPKSGTSR